MTRRPSLFLVLLALSAATLPAAEQGLVFALANEPPTLDPGLNNYFDSSVVLQNLFRGLYRMDRNDSPVPSMASGFTLDATKTVYTFTLRQGVRWSDGRAVTAEDFEYSWKRVLAPATGSGAAFYLHYLKGGKAYNEGRARAEEVGVRALDARTLRVTLESPTPYFLDLLCVTAYFPVRRDIVEGDDGWTTRVKTFVCNGPFMVEELKPRERYLLRRNPAYVDASAVRLERLEFRFITSAESRLAAYERGEAQVIDNPGSEALRKYRSSGEYRSFPCVGIAYLDFNTATKPFDDLRVRRAFALAIDRDRVIAEAGLIDGEPAFGLVPYGIRHGVQAGMSFRAVAGNPFREDLAEAKRLLAAAGFPGGRNFPPSTLIIWSSRGGLDLGAALQAAWKRNLGVSLDLAAYDMRIYWDEIAAGSFNIGGDGWTGDYPDPMTTLEIFGSTLNASTNRWDSPEYDSLLATARASADQGIRMAAFEKAECLLAEQVPVIPLYFPSSSLLCKPGVEGVRKNYIGHTLFEEAWVK